MKTPFLGPHSISRSTNFSDNVLINLFPTITETGDAKAIGAFYMTPGLDLWLNVGTGPIRGMLPLFAILIVVSGNQVWSVSPFKIATLLGTIGTSAGMVSMIANRTQLAFFDGMAGYLVTGAGLSTISLPFSNPGVATIQDGIGLVQQLNTNIVWQSDVEDLSTWNALNFSSEDGDSDNIIAINSIHREIWVLKTTETAIWINAGNPGFAFQRLEGVYNEAGIAAANSLSQVGESLAWLSKTHQGLGIVVMTRGYAPSRISTQSIEYNISQWPTLDDAVGFSYEQSGHLFYVLTSPSGNETLVYDVTASTDLQSPVWHKRAAFANGSFSRWLAATQALYFDTVLFGDYANGNIYTPNMASNTDNGAQRKWVRSWRALKEPTMQPIRFSSLAIDMQTGIGVPDGTNPLLQLDWSDDGGHNWSNVLFGSAGKTGETAKRVKFNRLGATKRDHGLDRIFRLSSTDPFAVALINAELE